MGYMYSADRKQEMDRRLRTIKEYVELDAVLADHDQLMAMPQEEYDKKKYDHKGYRGVIFEYALLDFGYEYDDEKQQWVQNPDELQQMEKLAEMKFRISYKKYPYSAETTICIVTGMDRAYQLFTEKCLTCENVKIEKYIDNTKQK